MCPAARSSSNFENVDLQTSFLLCRYTFRIPRSSSCTKVIVSSQGRRNKNEIYERNWIHIFAGGPFSVARQSCWQAHLPTVLITEVASKMISPWSSQTFAGIISKLTHAFLIYCMSWLILTLASIWKRAIITRKIKSNQTDEGRLKTATTKTAIYRKRLNVSLLFCRTIYSTRMS